MCNPLLARVARSEAKGTQEKIDRSSVVSYAYFKRGYSPQKLCISEVQPARDYCKLLVFPRDRPDLLLPNKMWLEALVSIARL